MIRGMTILWVLLVLVVSSAMFLMKFQVQNLEDQLSGLNLDIRRTHDEIRVLSAEWAYLNDPARISDLASRLLGLDILDGQAIIQIADLPLQEPHPAGPTLANHTIMPLPSRHRTHSGGGKP